MLRAETTDDSAGILRLNANAASVTSPMDPSKYLTLLSMRAYATVVEIEGEIVGFIMAIRDGNPHEDGIYRWFGSRLRNFIYIDRIVVDENRRGLGIGRLLYSHLFKWSMDRQITQLTAEINIFFPMRRHLRFTILKGLLR
ncbi:GNAT family N-acetyltransferase [Luteolibacter algae]|uniref:GNAT family N-acetyltransferase n=1 Tax=Luteolibacter algae TaxID=454151 RepID=UPI0036D7B717